MTTDNIQKPAGSNLHLTMDSGQKPVRSRIFNNSKPTNQIIAIDLGTRSTKAVCMEEQGDALRLVSYTAQDRPDCGKVLSREALARHLLAVTESLNARTKKVILIVGATDSLICHAELPVIETSEMRKMVKLNPKFYFQEDLPNHSFDCFVLHQGTDVKAGSKQSRKAKTLIVAVKNQVLNDLQEAAGTAGLDIQQVTASQTGAANCFLMSPEIWHNKVIALVDIGFGHSTISLLVNGEITLTRVVNIGADKFTTGLAEGMNITYSVADGLKQIMPEKVRAHLIPLVSPLSHELINSIHFFEQKEDKKVSEVFVSGGSARSKFIVETLQTELNLPCKSWNPAASLKSNFTSAQTIVLQEESPQLTVAIGAALTFFKTALAAIDLLAEQKEAAERRSRDPMKRGYVVAGILVLAMLGWYLLTLFFNKQVSVGVKGLTSDLASLQPGFIQTELNIKKADSIRATLHELNQLSQTRFLWASALNALQETVVNNFEIVRLQINQDISQTTGTPAVKKLDKIIVPAQPPETIEHTVFTIQAKSSAKPSAAESFMNAIALSPWFKTALRSDEAIRLKESQPPQTDPSDLNKISILFTVECYAEQKFK